jgi:flagellar biosynthesis/type III secretory pathway protein FliH
MPMVKAQVESQIKVRDMSNVSVSLEPAEFSSWQEARTSLMAEAKAGLKAKLEAELASMANESQLDGLRDAFSKEERELEHTMDHQVHTFSAILDLDYK